MKKGSRITEEHRRKLSEAKKGRPSSFKGKRLSPESRLKMSLAKRGREHTLEHREANRQGQIRRHLRTNPEYVMSSRNSRIARNGGFHSKGEWETLKAQYDWKCPSCLKKEPDIKLTKDHIVPLLRGGSDNIENLQPLCQPCNSKKGTNERNFNN